jgi:hypothetical protein
VPSGVLSGNASQIESSCSATVLQPVASVSCSTQMRWRNETIAQSEKMDSFGCPVKHDNKNTMLQIETDGMGVISLETYFGSCAFFQPFFIGFTRFLALFMLPYSQEGCSLSWSDPFWID